VELVTIHVRKAVVGQLDLRFDGILYHVPKDHTADLIRVLVQEIESGRRVFAHLDEGENVTCQMVSQDLALYFFPSQITNTNSTNTILEEFCQKRP
jgi:hypothetical protein